MGVRSASPTSTFRFLFIAASTSMLTSVGGSFTGRTVTFTAAVDASAESTLDTMRNSIDSVPEKFAGGV